MADICREIMRHLPGELDICDHNRELQDCPKCRKSSATDVFATFLPRAELPGNNVDALTTKLEKALAESKTK